MFFSFNPKYVIRAVVVVKWSECSPSILTIRVRTDAYSISVKFVFKRTKINKKYVINSTCTVLAVNNTVHTYKCID